MASKAEALYGRKKQRADIEAMKADTEYANEDTGADSYEESQSVLDSVNAAIKTGKGLQREVEGQQFLKMSDEEKKKFLKSKGKM